jgi:uncharacterized protein YceH (UPF0502 family)
MNTTADTTAPRAIRPLTPLEARVVGVLVEKQLTVPDTYPLSLNSLTSGCNQKTARSPVMNVSDSDVLAAIDGLKRLSLVLEGSSSRVPRFEHNMQRVLRVPSQAVALLTALVLRGPQTAAELRSATTRLHGFADVSSVESFLDELAGGDSPYVVKLARVPGERESRWAHLLCGEPSIDETRERAAADDAAAPLAEIDALRAEQRHLAAKVERLEALVAKMARELGIEHDQDAPSQD